MAEVTKHISSPAQAAQLVGVLSCTPEGGGVDTWLGYKWEIMGRCFSVFLSPPNQIHPQVRMNKYVFLLFRNYKVLKEVGPFFFLATCKMTLGHEIFPADIRERVEIYKLLSDAGSSFHLLTLGGKMMK